MPCRNGNSCQRVIQPDLKQKEIITMMKIENITNPRTGQEIQLCTATGWTGNPEYAKYYPGDEAHRSRYTTYLLCTEDESGERHVLRVNFWNGIGEAAHKALEGKSALIELKGCRVSHYVDLYGTQRFSVNVNRESEYRVLDFTPFVPAGTGFKDIVDMAKRSASATVEETSDVPF
jgi:hypothetical protein